MMVKSPAPGLASPRQMGAGAFPSPSVLRWILLAQMGVAGRPSIEVAPDDRRSPAAAALRHVADPGQAIHLEGVVAFASSRRPDLNVMTRDGH